MSHDERWLNSDALALELDTELTAHAKTTRMLETAKSGWMESEQQRINAIQKYRELEHRLGNLQRQFQVLNTPFQASGIGPSELSAMSVTDVCPGRASPAVQFED